MAGNGAQDNVIVLDNQNSGVLTPCVCGPQATCPMGNQIISSDCCKPHRLDCQRDNRFSPFLCLCCGVYVLKREKEIKSHMINCSHGLFPFALVDSDMCGCECVHRCDSGIGLMNTYFVQYVAERQELKHPAYPDPFSCNTWVKSDPWEVEYAQETFEVRMYVRASLGWSPCVMIVGNPIDLMINEIYANQHLLVSGVEIM